mgnify:CR=1 FL=1
MFNNFQFGTNELIWLLLLFVNYLVILISYRMWGKVGLFIFVPISVILANIQVLKMMTLFGVNTTMGNIAYGGVFLVSDILSENYGKKMAQHIISIGFYTLISFVVIMNVVLLITPAPNDIAQPHLEIIFKAMPRIIIASLSAFVVAQNFDVWSYQVIRKLRPSYSDIWIRNNVSTIVSQMIDNVVFTLVAFLGVYPIKELVIICISTYFLKIIISILDTPYVYLAAKWKEEGKIRDITQIEEEFHEQV